MKNVCCTLVIMFVCVSGMAAQETEQLEKIGKDAHLAATRTKQVRGIVSDTRKGVAALGAAQTSTNKALGDISKQEGLTNQALGTLTARVETANATMRSTRMWAIVSISLFLLLSLAALFIPVIQVKALSYHKEVENGGDESLGFLTFCGIKVRPAVVQTNGGKSVVVPLTRDARLRNKDYSVRDPHYNIAYPFWMVEGGRWIPASNAA